MGSAWLMALFGHSGSHAPQLMQSSVMVVAIDEKTPGIGLNFNYLFPVGMSMFACRLQEAESSCYLSSDGGVPKWLRERSAKPRCSGSNPLAASKFCLKSFNNPSPRPL